MTHTRTRVRELARHSLSDWSGFLVWVVRVGLLGLVLFGISLAADWATERVFGGRSDALSILGTQALDAVWNGFAFGVFMTILLVRDFTRQRTGYLFALMWLGFSIFSFVLSVSIPLPLWQVLAMKLAVCAVGFWIVWRIRKRWWRDFWIAADSEEEKHA